MHARAIQLPIALADPDRYPDNTEHRVIVLDLEVSLLIKASVFVIDGKENSDDSDNGRAKRTIQRAANDRAVIRRSAALADSLFPAAPEHVREHRDEEYGADDQWLPVCIEVQEVHPVNHKRENDAPGQCAQQTSRATEQRRATDQDGRDNGEQEWLAHG